MNAIADVVERAKPIPKKVDSWVAYLRPNPQAGLRLFCFPYAGGGASVFRPWINNLIPGVEVVPVQYPGREGRISESHILDSEQLAEAALAGLTPYFDRPFAFFGHSMGARLAFDVARLMESQALRMPAHLFLSGCRAPLVSDPEPPIHELPDDQFIAELRNYNGTPKTVLENKELMTLYLPTLRADFGLCASHPVVEPAPLSSPISVYGGLQDLKMPKKELEPWEGYTNSGFQLRMFPGDHFFIHSNQDLVMRILCRELTKLIQYC